MTSKGTAFHSHEWLCAYEADPSSPVYDARHIEIVEGNITTGVASFYHISHDPHLNSYSGDYNLVDKILTQRMLVCHSWYSYYNFPCLTKETDTLTRLLLNWMNDESRKLNIPIHGFPGVPEGHPIEKTLEAQGFIAAYSEATSVAILPRTATMANYLASLRKKVRDDLKRRARRALEQGLRISDEKRPQYLEIFAGLLKNICDKHNAPLSNSLENLRSMFLQFGERLHFLTLWHDSVMLGGIIILEFNGVGYIWIVGIDYDLHKIFSTYFLLFYFGVEYCLDRGLNRLEAGRGGYDTKVRLGFRPVYLRSWFRATERDGMSDLAASMAAIEKSADTKTRVNAAYRSSRAIKIITSLE